MPEAKTLTDPAGEIFSALLQIHRWVDEWMNFTNFEIATLSSTMAACDAALMAVAAETDIYLYTSFAHPTIELSVRQTARTVGGVRRREVPVARIDLDSLDLSCGEGLARTLADRVAAVAEGRRAALVLEHVTYGHGVRLPVGRIADYLSRICPDLRLIIDGAQAVGIWRPPPIQFAAYLGCFHKFVGAPHGSAFLALAPPFADQLQAHVRNLSVPTSDSATPTFQTVDIHKLRRTAQILAGQHKLSDLPDILNRIARFNYALEANVAPRITTLGAGYDPELRSHITTIRFGSDREARVAVEVTAGCGYVVQQFGPLLRVSAGSDVDPDWGSSLGRILAGVSQRSSIALFFAPPTVKVPHFPNNRT